MRLKFQTKLMFTVALVVIIVTGLVITATEDKVRETYIRLAAERARAHVDQFVEGRAARLEGQGKKVDELVSSAEVRTFFVKGDFSSKALREFGNVVVKLAGSISSGKSQNNVGAQDRPASQVRNSKLPLGEKLRKRQMPVGVGIPINKALICLVDREGRLHPLGGANIRAGKNSRKVLMELGKLENVSERQVGYLVLEVEDGANQLVEVVAAPVRNGEDGEMHGAILMGVVVDFARSPMARMGERGPSFMGGEPLLGGVLVEGEVFSKGLSQKLREDIQIATSQVSNLGEEPLLEGVELTEGENSYGLFCKSLNPGGSLPPSYQVVLYPLNQLKSDLMNLRLKGSGVGTGAMWAGVFLAWLVSRRFARPIRELAGATREIREGNFEVKVPVRSRDELGDLAKSFNEMADELKTKEQIRDVLGKVADEAVAEALISGSLELGGETRQVSVLFCDIRNFTTLSETMEPTDVIELLNDHMTAMTRIVHEHHGVVDKFVGDEIMAVFGAPKAYGDDAANAARCALEMLEMREHLNQKTGHPFEVGIGIATGNVVVGCIGSMDRLNYTVIGERVNRAARLCGFAEATKALVDESTWQALSGRGVGRELPNVSLKGYSGEVRAFQLEAMQQGEEQLVGENVPN